MTIGPQPDLGIPELVDPVVVGRGGSGVVYKARQPRLNRVVAVKVLPGYLDTGTLERFEREAFVMGTVAGHPNIVPIYSAGRTEDARPYLMMQFVAGGTLAERVPMPWPEAVAHAIKIAGALETAHRAGVLHRDLKPANVLLSDFGEPLLTDFGISRIVGGLHTTEGLISASLPYAAPEVFDSGEASVAADVYSLAAMLFCLINGAPPFAAPSGEPMYVTYVRISRDPVPDLRPSGVPGPVCRAIEIGLAKNPARRPHSAAEFGRLLQRTQKEAGQPVTEMRLVANPAHAPASVVRGEHDPVDGSSASETSTAQVVTTRKLRGRTLFVAAVAVAAAMVGAILLWPGKDDPKSPRRAFPGVIADLGRPTGLAIDDEGSVYVSDEEHHKIYRVTLGGQVSTFAGTGAADNTGNGGPAAMATLSDPSELAFGPDGSLYVSTGGFVRRIGADGVIRPVLAVEEGFDAVGLAVASDGTLYAASAYRIIVARDLSGPAVTFFDTGINAIADIAIHPVEGWLAVADVQAGRIVRVNPDGTSTPLAGVAPGAGGTDTDGAPASRSRIGGPTGLTFSADGQLYFTEIETNRVRTIQPDGTLKTVAGSGDGPREAGYSGDGGPAADARFDIGDGRLAIDDTGLLFIADEGNGRVRVVTADGMIRSFA